MKNIFLLLLALSPLSLTAMEVKPELVPVKIEKSPETVAATPAPVAVAAEPKLKRIKIKNEPASEAAFAPVPPPPLVITAEQLILINSPSMLLELALRYYSGQGVERDYSKARELFAHILQQHWLGLQRYRAAYYLGKIYLDGSGVERNLKKAQEYFQIAANPKGNYGGDNSAIWRIKAAAKFHLAEIYAENYGVDKKNSTAISLYEEAASQTDNPIVQGHAEIRLARIYMQRAEKLMRSAAQRGLNPVATDEARRAMENSLDQNTQILRSLDEAQQ